VRRVQPSAASRPAPLRPVAGTAARSWAASAPAGASPAPGRRSGARCSRSCRRACALDDRPRHAGQRATCRLRLSAAPGTMRQDHVVPASCTETFRLRTAELVREVRSSW
jgi:hypothetical protein